MRYLLLCLLTSLTTYLSFAQTDLTDYHTRHFTSENGLSQNTVKAIAPDDYNFIWLATESGLLRFDGNSFKRFDKNNTGIRTSRMFDIQRNAADNGLLAITSTGELLAIAKGKAQMITECSPYGLLPAPVKKISGRSFKWRRGQVQSDSLFFRTDKHMGALLALKYGITWYGDGKQAYNTRISGLNNSKELFFFDHAVYRIAEGPAGDTLQRITPGGVRNVMFKNDFEAAQKQHRSKDYFIEINYATGQTFVFTGQCLYLAQPLPDGSISTELLVSGFDLDKLLVCCAYYDSLHQRIFIGSLTSGLYILDRKKFHTVVYHGKAAHPSINVVYDQVALNDSAVLTGNGTVCYTNPAILPAYIGFPGDSSHHRADPVFRAANGDIWVCGIDSIFLLNNTATGKKNEWAFAQPTTLAESKDGRIWIGTENRGLFVMDTRIPHPTPQLALNVSDYIMSIKNDGEQYLWICTMRRLLRMNINTGAVDTIAGLNDKMARSVYIREPGEVWICTYEDGLFLWQKNRLTHFPITNYPNLKTVHKILEDEQGYFWISTNQGIYQARRTDLLAYANGKQEDPYLFYYSKESGFLTNEFNGGSPYVGTKLANGFLSFSSMNGIVFFKASAVKPELPEGRFIIDKLEVDDKEIAAHNGIVTLNRRFRTFKVSPASAYMGDPENLKYEFRLNNDSDWRNTYNGTVILSSLPVGYNNLFIRKKSGFGRGNYMTCKLLIYVPPAWWQTRWFYVSAILVLVVLIWLIVRLRVRHWKHRNLLLETAIERRTQDLKDIIHDLEDSENRLGEQLQFQTKLNEQITHDITTPLKYLSVFTRQISNRAENEQNAEMRYLHQDVNRIYEVVQNLGEYMRTRLLKNISRTSFNMYELVKQKADLFKIAAAAGNNVIENNVNPALFINQNESLISIVLHNIIDNAVKNTENGKIIISATAENNIIMLSISDNGRGMPPALIKACNDYFITSSINRSLLNAGFGFQIIKEIAILQKLEINITANHPRGINFRVLISQNEYDILLD